jgi:hypothetical protein
MTLEAKPKEYVLVRSLDTDALFAVTADCWADYKCDTKGRPLKFEEVTSGDKGYLTMLEQLSNDDFLFDKTEDYK